METDPTHPVPAPAGRKKTYKREIAFATLLFWAGLIVWGHIDPTTGAHESGLAITMPVILLVASAFGIDAVFKHRESEFTVARSHRDHYE